MQGQYPRERATKWLTIGLAGILLSAAGCGAPGATTPATPVASIPTAEILPQEQQSGLGVVLPVLPTVTPTPPAEQTRPTPPPPQPPTPQAPTADAAPLPPAPTDPAPPLAERAAIDPALAAELQRILDETVSDGYIPGAVLSVHLPDEQTWSGASGFVDEQRTLPMEPNTQVRIASISKVFTAVVVLQLVEEGALDLETPVAEWFPGLLPSGDAVTVRRLLNHTSGLYDYLEDRRYLGKAFENPEYRWAPEELVAYAATNPPLFPPGASGAWDYSSTNYVLLGMIVERVTGNSLAAEMRRRIFEPLELQNTYFPPDETVPGVQARGYRNGYDYTDLSLSFAFATANMVSTADDVRRFGEALFRGRLLEQETLELMFTFENGKGQYNMPALEYGLGVMRNQLDVGIGPGGQQRAREIRSVVGHTGGFGGFRTALWHAPESGVTIALGMNQGGTDPNPLAARVLDAVLRARGM